MYHHKIRFCFSRAVFEVDSGETNENLDNGSVILFFLFIIPNTDLDSVSNHPITSRELRGISLNFNGILFGFVVFFGLIANYSLHTIRLSLLFSEIIETNHF